MSKGVAAECIDLQSYVASLRAELKQSPIRANDLSGKLTGKMVELESTEEARTMALARVAALEEIIRVFRSERMSEAEMAVFREAQLDE